jgi:hypothetical protein
LANGKQIDNRLIGVWKGSENGKQLAGSKKRNGKWNAIQMELTLNFKTILDGVTDEF